MGPHPKPRPIPTRMARASRSAKPSRAGGYTAVDLTVRDDGHVRPPLVATNLPLMLQGIRSTGAICTMIGVNFAPPSNGADTTWITSQFVHEILSVAGANGITKYRYNNAGNTVPSFPANTFGATMTAQLDQVRLESSPPGGDQCHVRGHAGRGPYARRATSARWWSPMPIRCRASRPSLIGINFAMDHVATAAPGGWQILLRRWMPYVGNVCVEDLGATVNATTGALSIGERSPPVRPAWAGRCQLGQLLPAAAAAGGYSGFSESQLEYSIIGGTGTSVSLNNAAFADSAQFTSGQLTPEIMLGEFKVNSDFIRARAIAGGWTRGAGHLGQRGALARGSSQAATTRRARLQAGALFV